MQGTPTPMTPKKHPKGVTLIELTVVISTILALLSSLFVGASYYRDSANQAACITQITQMQKGIRSYQNLNTLSDGEDISGIMTEIIGPDKAIPSNLNCPLDKAAYTLLPRIPLTGEQFATCTNFDSSVDSTQSHTPTSTVDF